MTDPVCAHGQTAAQGCVWCPKKPGGTEYETGYDRAPINREQIMLGDITDLRERVSDIERQLANCATPQEPPSQSQDNCDTIAPPHLCDMLVRCEACELERATAAPVTPSEQWVCTGNHRYCNVCTECHWPHCPSSEPVQATAQGDSPTQSDRLLRASGSEPFDLRLAIQKAIDDHRQNVRWWEDWNDSDCRADPPPVPKHNNAADAVLSVLRSTAFRQHAYSLDHKADTQWCNSCYNQDRRNSLGCTQDLLTELFGEVES